MVKNILIVSGCVLAASAIAYGVYEYIRLSHEKDALDAQLLELRATVNDANESLAVADVLAMAILNRYESTKDEEAVAEEAAAKFVEHRKVVAQSKPTLATVDGVPVFDGAPMDHDEMRAAHVYAMFRKQYIEGVAEAASKPVAEVEAIFDRFPEATDKLLSAVIAMTKTAVDNGAANDGSPDSIDNQVIRTIVANDPEIAELNAALAALAESSEISAAG